MEEIEKSIGEEGSITLKEAINKVYRELDDELGIEENKRNAERDLHSFTDTLIDITRERLAKRYILKGGYDSDELWLYHEDG